MSDDTENRRAERDAQADGATRAANAAQAVGADRTTGAAQADGGLPPIAHVDAGDVAPSHMKAYGGFTVVYHEAVPHEDGEEHHHHTHGARTHHVHGHHLLQVESLNVSFEMYDEDRPFFKAGKHEARVIEDLSLSLHYGEILAVVGASGSGKTLLADSVLGLFEPNATVSGRVWFDGEACGADDLARLRGNGISLVPQSVNNLDPLMKVGRQVEGMPRGRGKARRDDRERRRRKRRELFARYGLDESVADLYPFELSGGMARRVLLCCALMDDPRVIVADEPTPGLDLDLALAALGDLREFADDGGGVMLITHDIELALRVADRVAVFRDGTVVEETSVENFASPDTLRHPFSKALWHALPEHDFAAGEEDEGDEGDERHEGDKEGPRC